MIWKPKKPKKSEPGARQKKRKRRQPEAKRPPQDDLAAEAAEMGFEDLGEVEQEPTFLVNEAFEQAIGQAVWFVHQYGVPNDPAKFLAHIGAALPGNTVLGRGQLEIVQERLRSVQFPPGHPAQAMQLQIDQAITAVIDPVRTGKDIATEFEELRPTDDVLPTATPPQPETVPAPAPPKMVEARRPTAPAFTEEELKGAFAADDFSTGDLLSLVGVRKKRSFDRWGGKRPPEYHEDFEGTPMSLDRLKQLYTTGHLKAGEERKLPPRRRIAGVYIELTPNSQDPKKRPTIVYHRFDSSEWEQLKLATAEAPLIIGRGYGDRHKGSFIHLPTEDYEMGWMDGNTGEDARIAEQHVALWIDGDTIAVKNLTDMDGVHAIVPKKKPA